MKTMIAKYPGQCIACKKPIARGQVIKFHGRGRAEHQYCFQPDGPQPASEVRAPCWICGDPAGKFRNLGAATPVWCDACFEEEGHDIARGSRANEDEAAGLEDGTLANDRRLAKQGLSVIRFSSGAVVTQNSRGRCIDAPCCGCCS